MSIAEQRQHAIRRLGFCAAIAVPFVYFGVQIVAAPFYPEYRWVEQLASELGARNQASAAIFNAGMFLTGALTILSAPAFWLTLRSLTGRTLGAVAAALTLASSGGATVWAALNPLPSVIHNPGLWGVGTVLFPAVLAWTARDVPRFATTRFYLWSSVLLAIAVLIFIEAGLAGEVKGLVQRGAAVLVYVPIAVGAYCLIRRSH